MKMSKVSLVVLAIQLAIVSSIAAKYLYQRWGCPRVWVKSMVYDPEMLMRGRYLSMQVTVDGCQNTMPATEQAASPIVKDGAPAKRMYLVRGELLEEMSFPARIRVQDGKLVAIRIPEEPSQLGAQTVLARPGANCTDMQLETPVDFYISEHAADPTPAKRGQELWVELTVPPNGPPRPLQLALKDNGAWKPLAFQ